MKKELEENEKGEEREENEEVNSNGAMLEEDDDKVCDDDEHEIVQNDQETVQDDQDASDKVDDGGQSESESAPAANIVALKLNEGVKEMSSAFEKQTKKEDAVKKGPADGNEGSKFKRIC